MNTSNVAEILGVSSSTIKRWVKQLNLPMERNERGHYTFTTEDLEVLKKIHEQIQNGAILQEITHIPEKKTRKAILKRAIEPSTSDSSILLKLKELEARIDQKADSVTSYQLLQHRREIEDLQEQVDTLTAKLEIYEAHFGAAASSFGYLQVAASKEVYHDAPLDRRKKKNAMQNLIANLKALFLWRKMENE